MNRNRLLKNNLYQVKVSILIFALHQYFKKEGITRKFTNLTPVTGYAEIQGFNTTA